MTNQWLHDDDPNNEWYYVDDMPIGVTREDGGARWAPAYVDDGLPAGPTNDYQWSDLETAKERAVSLNRRGR